MDQQLSRPTTCGCWVLSFWHTSGTPGRSLAFRPCTHALTHTQSHAPSRQSRPLVSLYATIIHIASLILTFFHFCPWISMFLPPLRTVSLFCTKNGPCLRVSQQLVRSPCPRVLLCPRCPSFSLTWRCVDLVAFVFFFIITHVVFTFHSRTLLTSRLD